ncbi:MAG: agmatinase [Candidatus Aminicenantales bacterium]
MSDFGDAIKESRDFDVAILGIPFDAKSCYLRGAAKGPQAIRAASSGKAIDPWTELGVNLEDDLVMVDRGDLKMAENFIDNFSLIEKEILFILDKGAVPIILGGDHSITYPLVKAFRQKFKEIDILHFDAHPDLSDELYGDRFSHACPLARILEDGLCQRVVQVGIRAATGEHWQQAQKYGVEMIEMKTFKSSLALNFDHPLYISFDLDALDPAFAPGVAHHEPGGLTTRQVIGILHRLKAEIVGMDVVELNPDRDPSGITAAAAVKIIKEVAGKICYQISKSGAHLPRI